MACTDGSIGFEALVSDRRGETLCVDGVSGSRVQGALRQASAESIAPQP